MLLLCINFIRLNPTCIDLPHIIHNYEQYINLFLLYCGYSESSKSIISSVTNTMNVVKEAETDEKNTSSWLLESFQRQTVTSEDVSNIQHLLIKYQRKYYDNNTNQTNSHIN